MWKINWRIWLLLAAGVSTSFAALGQTAVQPRSPAPLCIDAVCPPDETESSPQGIKWHPGFYVWYTPSNNFVNYEPSHQQAILNFIDSIGNEPSIKGIQVIGYWGEFESDTAGDYSNGFASVDAILARLQKYGKYLQVAINPAHFGSYPPANYAQFFPKYLVQPENGGTDYSGKYGISLMDRSPDGLQARVWQTATSDRFIAMIRAYGARYNGHPNFEMIGFGETSINTNIGTDGFSWPALDEQIRRHLAAARAAFPNTGVRFVANWYFTNPAMISLIDYAVSLGCAIGGPDVLPNEAIAANQAFAGAGIGGTPSTDWRGVVPFVSEVQSPELGGGEGTWTNEQLYLSAMQGVATKSGGATGSGTAVYRAVRPQYFVWYYNDWAGGAEQQWRTGTLPFIRKINGAVASTSCPKGYKSGCRTD